MNIAKAQNTQFNIIANKLINHHQKLPRPNNVSQESFCLRAGVIMSANRYTYPAAATSELETPTFELQHSRSELGTSTSELDHPSPELQNSSSELGTSTLELDTSRAELQNPSSKLGTSSFLLKI